MRSLLFALLVCVLVAAILLASPAMQFRDSLGAVPPGVRLAGTNFGSADAEAIANSLNTLFGEPVAVYYAGQRIILRPQSISFRVDVPAMLAEAQKHATLPRLAVAFLADLANRRPRLGRRSTPLYSRFSRARQLVS